MEGKLHKGQKELFEKVACNQLCTGCGACVNLCPYQRSYDDKIISLFDCDLDEGRCFAFCPRTPTDLEKLRNKLFNKEDLTPEIGAIKSFYVTRSADPAIRNNAQHGGTVTALMSLALKEDIIDTAILAKQGDSLLPSSISEKSTNGAEKHGKSSFVVSPNVAEFNLVSNGDTQKIGVVATPCQTLSFAKMRMKPIPEKDNNIDKLKLVIGLFCGWALSWEKLFALVNKHVDLVKINGIDIPPSKHQSMHIYTNDGIVEIPIEEVNLVVRSSCHYCYDMTAEFSDISVGSARLPEGWDTARGWNQVIARTDLGLKLMELARKKGVLEFKDVPDGNLERLKNASMKKKQTAIKNLNLKTQSKDDLVYISSSDPVFAPLL